MTDTTDMTAGEIVGALSESRGMPYDALYAASRRRSEMLPVFLAAIEAELTVERDMDVRETPVFFIVHLLAEWREKTAYRLLLRLLRLPSDRLEPLLGDAITETMPRVVASVYDGDPQPLFDAILDRDADPSARSSLCETIAILAHRGDLDRALATRFLRDAFTAIVPQGESHVWFGWQETIIRLQLEELKPLVRKAYARDFIDPVWGDYEEFEEVFASIARSPEADDPGWHELFEDTALELGHWAFAQENDLDDPDEEDDTWLEDEDDFDTALRKYERLFGRLDAAPHEAPIVNPFRDVGRNDPCPCGSGKKYKKCCLR